MMANPLLLENVWLQQPKYEDAESLYQRILAGTSSGGAATATATGAGEQTSSKQSSNKQQGSTLKSEIAQARQNIQKALNEPGSKTTPTSGDPQLVKRIKNLEDENNNLKKASKDLSALVKKLEERVSALELSNKSSGSAAPEPVKKEEKAADSDSDDLFGSDSDSDSSEDEETRARLAAYAAKKANKPKVIAKSSLLIDVKPWDDETDMKELENFVRTVEMDGLLWGASKLVPVGYGIKKLQINAVIEDDKVSTDELEERITAFEDLIQSMDIAAFNKI